MGGKGGGLGTTVVLSLVTVVLGAARGNEVLDSAQQNAEDGIRAFITTLGFEEVRFR
ncbi:MAG: hypothetical protein H0U55_00770 [Rubrobacteraceae bacterium]|nr:hypothetical protein [Rubrobacteraceae bacterium]